MKILKMLGQHRRDFRAVFECEHCGAMEEKSGYDDEFFHTVVIPGMACGSCGKTAPDSYEGRATKHPEGFQL